MERIDQPGKGWKERCSGEELCTIFLSALCNDKFRNMTGLLASNQNKQAELFVIMRRQAPRFARLLELLAKMFGSAALEARTFLREEELFQSIVEPSNQLPDGFMIGIRSCEPETKSTSLCSAHESSQGENAALLCRGQAGDHLGSG